MFDATSFSTTSLSETSFAFSAGATPPQDNSGGDPFGGGGRRRRRVAVLFVRRGVGIALFAALALAWGCR